MPTFDITGLNKAMILKNFYNIGKVRANGGLVGVFIGAHKSPMTTEEAEELLKNKTSFDYINGIAIKIDISGNTLYTNDFDNYYYSFAGTSAFIKALKEMKKIKNDIEAKKFIINEK